jgi:hypothetical protein
MIFLVVADAFGNVGVDMIRLVPSEITTLPAVEAALGYVGVEATQFVPSARKMVPVPVAVAGNVAIVHVGSAEAPCD